MQFFSCGFFFSFGEDKKQDVEILCFLTHLVLFLAINPFSSGNKKENGVVWILGENGICL